MEPVRLLTIGLPNLLNDLLTKAIERSGSLRAVDCYEDLQEFLDHELNIEPTVVIVESMAMDDCQQIFQSYQKIQLICVENSGKNFDLWELVPKKQVLGEVSLDELVNRVLSKDISKDLHRTWGNRD